MIYNIDGKKIYGKGSGPLAQASKEEVSSFLEEYRRRFQECGGLKFIRRWESNGDAIAELGETAATSEILTLSSKEYIKGPEEDITAEGEVWIFGKVVGGNEYYIKIKMSPTDNSPICLSFKPSKRTMKYPYAESLLGEKPEEESEQG